MKVTKRISGLWGTGVVLGVVCLTTVVLAEDFGSLGGGYADYGSGGEGSVQQYSGAPEFRSVGEAVKSSVESEKTQSADSGDERLVIQQASTSAEIAGTVADFTSIPLSSSFDKFETRLQLGAAENYAVSVGPQEQLVSHDPGRSTVGSQISFSGPTDITYEAEIVDQGVDSADLLHFLAPSNDEIVVLNSDSVSPNFKVNNQGEGNLGIEFQGATQSMQFDASGNLSGITVTYGGETSNIAIQSDSRIFGNVFPGYWNLEDTDNKYDLLQFEQQYGEGLPEYLTVGSFSEGSTGFVPLKDPQLGDLESVHIKADTIEFGYSNGVTKKAEDFARSDVILSMGSDGQAYQEQKESLDSVINNLNNKDADVPVLQLICAGSQMVDPLMQAIKTETNEERVDSMQSVLFAVQNRIPYEERQNVKSIIKGINFVKDYAKTNGISYSEAKEFFPEVYR